MALAADATSIRFGDFLRVPHRSLQNPGGEAPVGSMFFQNMIFQDGRERANKLDVDVPLLSMPLTFPNAACLCLPRNPPLRPLGIGPRTLHHRVLRSRTLLNRTNLKRVGTVPTCESEIRSRMILGQSLRAIQCGRGFGQSFHRHFAWRVRSLPRSSARCRWVSLIPSWWGDSGRRR